MVEESAAHMHHVVSEHIAPGISASMKTLSSQAAQGADRMSEAVLGSERHQRVRNVEMDSFSSDIVT